jgi:hypothetical protein
MKQYSPKTTHTTMQFVVSIGLLFMIAGNLSEISRIVLPFPDNYRIITYIIFPSFLVLSSARSSNLLNKLQHQSDLIKYSWLLLVPIIVFYSAELFLQITFNFDGSIARKTTIQTITVILYVYFIIPRSYKRILTLQDYFLVLVKPYVYFVIFTSTATVVTAFMIISGVINPLSWDIPGLIQIDSDFASGRVNLLSMPLYLTLIENDPNGYTRYQGLSHEPHTSAMFSVPALFYWVYFSKGKRGRFVKYVPLVLILSFFLTLSTTFISSISIVALLYLFRSHIILRKKQYNQMLLVVIPVILLSVYFLFIGFSREWYNLKVISELRHGTHLNQYIDNSSIELFFGTGLLYAGDDLQVGYGILTLYVVILLSIFVICLRLFFYNKSEYILALPMIYYMIHSLKIPFHAYNEPFFIYLCVLTAFGLALRKDGLRQKS